MNVWEATFGGVVHKRLMPAQLVQGGRLKYMKCISKVHIIVQNYDFSSLYLYVWCVGCRFK